MGIAKTKIILLCFCLSSLAVAKVNYPFISGMKGSVQSLKNQDQSQKLKFNEVLTEKALIETGKDGLVRLELDAYSSLVLFENSVLRIPVITWGEGEMTELVLEKGQIRYNCEKNCTRSLVTPLSNEVFKNGEYLLSYSPESPNVQLIVLHGSQNFRGLENENEVTLSAGDKAVFQGLKENGEVTYDLLLKGRKVARGQMMPIVKITEEELASLDKKTEFKKIIDPKAKPKIVRTAKQICENPLGELNQCAWVCQGLKKKMKECDLTQPGVQCLRTRCNVNGQWGEAFPLSGKDNKCQLKPIVGRCD